MVTRGYLPLCYLLILAFLHVQILKPLQHFVCSVKMKVAFRCGFSTLMCHLHWYLQHFCCLSCEAPVRSKEVFSLARSVSQVTWFFPTLWSSWHGCPNYFAHEAPNIGHLLFSNATSRAVFDVERSRQCLFKTLPPTVDTLCASDHYTKFLPGFLRVKSSK